jgi:hypothetical protein
VRIQLNPWQRQVDAFLRINGMGYPNLDSKSRVTVAQSHRVHSKRSPHMLGRGRVEHVGGKRQPVWLDAAPALALHSNVPRFGTRRDLNNRLRDKRFGCSMEQCLRRARDIIGVMKVCEVRSNPLARAQDDRPLASWASILAAASRVLGREHEAIEHP